VALLDRARAALASGNPTGALEILDSYQQIFGKGNLRPEATYLRIQALNQSGQHAAARDLATRFLAEHPDTPHAAQVRPLTNP
jgi:outer membrane protein assembly factor BamD (BamD/ComL family)